MFVDSSTYLAANGKAYTRHLLRSSYRDNGKVKHRTIASLTSCTDEEIAAIKIALRHKDKINQLIANATNNTNATPDPQQPQEPITQGPSIGAIAVIAALAEQLGITAALGQDRAAKLALWQIIARVLDQGSRLSAVRLARDLGATAVLTLPSFDEDDLYQNLAWLEQNQSTIEQKLYTHRYPQAAPDLFLYDVTSTYLEGHHNALAAFGYNRDGKKGKKQIVIGLLCDDQGTPLSIQAFRGNTGDTSTVAAQIQKLQNHYHTSQITLVGDRGMIRGPQIKELQAAGLHHITAISKPQIQTMLASGELQMELFDNELAEITILPQTDSDQDNNNAPDNNKKNNAPERYIMRRNPQRQKEIQDNRSQKKATLEKETQRLNDYLAKHPRAKPATAQKHLNQRIAKLGTSAWLKAKLESRELTLEQNDQALQEESQLDGCYVIRTDLSAQRYNKEQIHDRYKSLSEVEQAFRRSKTVELEMRPVHVRKENSTRGHLLVVMLAYQIMKELGKRWAKLDLTVSEGLDRLNSYCAVEIAGKLNLLLAPRADVKELLEAAQVTLPTLLQPNRQNVSTKKKLPKSRPTRIK